MKRNSLLGPIASFALLPIAAFGAECGPEFKGAWVISLDAGNGQYSWVQFDYNEKRAIVKTMTTVGGPPEENGDTGPGVQRILDLQNSTLDGNLSLEPLEQGTCELTFGRSEVLVDKYGVAGTSIARKAQLTVDGSELRYCWMESGHQFGSCLNFQKRR